MRFLPIFQKPGDHGVLPPDEGFAGPLPVFYMNDYSVMGLRVSDREAALALLANHRYTVRHREGCRGVAIRCAADMRAIIDLLIEGGLAAEVADIAEQIYQG